ncbi:TPA: DGQHR domain-containing protein [Escherichia coli]|nr:DGQHR domain-containing protein [Escherichia coli]EFO9432896.1 DGQHR domain-containing protein [Escherichia coli]EHO6978831.1 DGQHR domain-containing protein [Escherichia coli]EHV4439746.1 DGQHR domain-containing protein [Escherichia coli]EJN7449128.1 DGQHR domain-containing protein [Escherichia coli]
MSFYTGKTIKVRQPFGDFYIASIPAKLLIQVCYSFAAQYGNEVLTGVQRGINENRVKAIAHFCSTNDAMFPTSVILSANLDANGETVSKPWYIDTDSNLVIPSSEINASIVDGQHRIEGLKKAIESGELAADFDLVCAIYFELPVPKQAEVFATINFNQQKVDKSLAYQLFGYDLDSVDSEFWSPDTLAIYLTRLLDKEDNSPLKGRIDFGMKKLDLSHQNKNFFDNDWYISTSTIVQGITSLISTNASKDRYYLHKRRLFKKDRSILKDIPSKAPLRDDYINNKDGQLYDLISDYFKYCNAFFWNSENINFMRKTIGIQALFDLLKAIVSDIKNKKGIISFNEICTYLRNIDIQKLKDLNVNYSGIGRSQIRDHLKKQCGIV